MNYMMLKLLGMLPMNEAGAEGGDAGGAAPAADAAAPAAGQTDATAAAQPTSLLGDLGKDGADPAKPADAADPAKAGEGEQDQAAQVPESYELKMPEGEELHEAAAPMVQELFKELGLPQEKAQQVLDKLLEIDKARQPTQEQINQHYEQQAAELNKNWAEECRKLPELGGANFEKSLETCSQVMVKFASPDLRNFLTFSGLGSNPEFFKFVHAIGSAMSQDTLVHGGDAGKGPRSVEKTLWPALQ